MKIGFRKVRSPKLRAKRNDRRRRRRTDPFLQQPRKTRKDGQRFAPVGDGFSMHGAKRRVNTDEEFTRTLREDLKHPEKESKGRLRRVLKRVWRTLLRKEKP